MLFRSLVGHMFIKHTQSHICIQDHSFSKKLRIILRSQDHFFHPAWLNILGQSITADQRKKKQELFKLCMRSFQISLDATVFPGHGVGFYNYCRRDYFQPALHRFIIDTYRGSQRSHLTLPVPAISLCQQLKPPSFKGCAFFFF